MGRRRSSFAYMCFCFLLIIFTFHNIIRRHRNMINQDVIPYDELNCKCPRFGPKITDNQNQSLCSDWSTSRGYGQNVVAYTLYGNMKDPDVFQKYYNQVERRLIEVDQFYPGWILRLYHNFTLEQTPAISLLCRLYCKYPYFDPCQIRNLYPKESKHVKGEVPTPSSDVLTKKPETNFLNSIVGIIKNHLKQDTYEDSAYLMLGNQEIGEDGGESLKFDYSIGLHKSITPSNIDPTTSISWKMKSYLQRVKGNSYENLLIGKMWRYLPMMDPTVDTFLVRDVDSAILAREVAAVLQWLQNSTAVVHAMRDHPSHNGYILAGMWGGSRVRGGDLLSRLMKEALLWPPKNLWDYDQTILRRTIWPEVSDNILVHDSYYCINPHFQAKHRALPFPTKREKRLFVSWGPGRDNEMKYIKPCPLECRPLNHQDWTYC